MSSAEITCPPKEYTFIMTQQDKEMAFKELREDDLIREQSLEQMRNWISKHPAIIKCRTDSPFLLRFLRYKKFSVPQACSFLENYLAIRQLYPSWYKNLNIDDSAMQDLINNGYLLPLPCRDSNNRRVLLASASFFDPHKRTNEDMIKIHTLIMEYLMNDETNQIYGLTLFDDFDGVVMGHISMWPLTELKLALKNNKNSNTMRFKQHHFINAPSIAKHLMDYALSFLSEKMKNRVFVHKNMDAIKDYISPSVLPKEYGGEIPIAVMIKDFKKELEAAKDSLLALDDMHIDLNCGYKVEGLMQDELGTGITGSFRKLGVD